MPSLPDYEPLPHGGFEIVPASLARAATGFGEASDAWSAAHDVLAACTLTADAFGALAQQRPLLADAVQAYNEAVADTRLAFARSATVLAESELTLKQIANVYAHVDEKYAEAFGYYNR